MRLTDISEAIGGDRPAELGDAYFWINHKLVDISPHRNHRDWLVDHAQQLGLPDYIRSKPVRALWEAYKKGVIRIVWDRGGKWKSGQGSGKGNVLYLNGLESEIWANMRPILNDPHWAGEINTVVIEYVREVDGKPNWFKTDIFKGGAIESLYRGKRPRRERLPADAVYGGEPGLMEGVMANKMVNVLNDHASGALTEMFQQHFLSSEFFDKLKYNDYNQKGPRSDPDSSVMLNKMRR